MKKVKRSLGEIADAIRARTESIADIIAIGGDLIEAKKQVKRGEWLPWLEREFDFSERTAQNYMQAHRFAAKYETVADSNLTPSALYDMAANTRKRFTGRVITEILKEAAAKRVGTDRVWQIIESQPPKTDKERIAEAKARAEARAKEEEDAAEAEAILDGPGPDLPPPEPAAKTDFALVAFDQAISKLKELSTKPADKFINSSHSARVIEVVAGFLLATIVKRKAAA